MIITLEIIVTGAKLLWSHRFAGHRGLTEPVVEALEGLPGGGHDLIGVLVCVLCGDKALEFEPALPDCLSVGIEKGSSGTVVQLEVASDAL